MTAEHLRLWTGLTYIGLYYMFSVLVWGPMTRINMEIDYVSFYVTELFFNWCILFEFIGYFAGYITTYSPDLLE
jgi:hypothetical protein